jgi:hypothetical protein
MACEWLGEWVQRDPPPWSGPDVVIVYARSVVFELTPGDPFALRAGPRERCRLRIAPGESPPATLHFEADDGAADVALVLFIPPSLGNGWPEESGW